MFNKILVANRGEIAVRILRTCREMGIQTVAVYSEVDAQALHVQLADEAVPAPTLRSYLDVEFMIATALQTGAEAIHPGYGFLSENARFAQRCTEAGLIFIGPEAQAIERMGDKARARDTMQGAGVPVTPGTDGVINTPEEALPVARSIGFPVLVKAVAGGGGRGMRLARTEGELQSAVEAARSEANSSFGNPDVYLEKYLEGCRHVEMQILADNYGHIVYLGERDCSIQRRNQKLIEESPSPAVSSTLREDMGAVAVAAAQAVHYRGAGTLEFLLAKDGNFYFMEMNTRLQVEHPVTEFICGLDLVREQIRIAAGEPLGYEQSDIRLSGWALECRINAEDPVTFMPSPGQVAFYRQPGGFGVRVDTALYPGYFVSPFYDSLIAKLIVYGRTRQEALERMFRALSEFEIQGVMTTIPFHLRLLAHPDFKSGDVNTHFVQDKMTAPDTGQEGKVEGRSDLKDKLPESKGESKSGQESGQREARSVTGGLEQSGSVVVPEIVAAISTVLNAHIQTKDQDWQILKIQPVAMGCSPWRMSGLYDQMGRV